MNKKGDIGIKEGVYAAVAIVILFAILGSIYFGVWKSAEGAVKEKLPAKESLQNLLKKFISPGKVEIEKQEIEANKIVRVINLAIGNMKDINDCIEELNFSDVGDKDFVLEFVEEEDGTKLSIYKIYSTSEGKQPGYSFPYKLKTPLAYFNEGKIIKDFKIVDKLEKVSFIDTNKEKKEEIKRFLYKDKEGRINFFSIELSSEEFKETIKCSEDRKDFCKIDSLCKIISNVPCNCYTAGGFILLESPEICKLEQYCYPKGYGCEDKSEALYQSNLKICKETNPNFKLPVACEVDTTCRVKETPCSCNTLGSKNDPNRFFPDTFFPDICIEGQFCYEGSIGCEDELDETKIGRCS